MAEKKNIDPNTVYISFTGKDKETVETFVGMLKANNIPYRVSIEEDIDSISEFEEEIGNGQIVVIFYSPDYFKSYHCMNEYALIRKNEQKNYIFTFKCDDFKFDEIVDDLFYYWGGVQRMVSKKMRTKGFDNLAEVQKAAYHNEFYIEEDEHKDKYEISIYRLENFFRDKRKMDLQTLLNCVKEAYQIYSIHQEFEQKAVYSTYDRNNKELPEREHIADIVPEYFKQKAVYITYARNSKEYPSWEHIADVVSELEQAFKDANIDYYVDKRDLKYGAKISEFEKAIGNAECVILIFSERYFQSRHCMYEYVQVKNGLKNGKIKKLICIKSGNCNLSDLNYIRGLHEYWSGKKGAFDFDKDIIDPAPVDVAAYENDFYLSEVRGLKNFFSDKVYAPADKLDKVALIKLLGAYKKASAQNKDTSSVIKPDVIVVEPQTKIVNSATLPIIIEGKSYGNMIFVKGGTFLMGAQKKDKTASNYDPEAYDDESPVHRVTLDDFYIGETQVTQGLWKAVMGDNPSDFKKGDDYPVECVSWNDIVNDFLPKLNRMTSKNFCLPTEAQWEYAARGGNKSKGYKYSGSDNLADVAVYWDNSQNDGDNHCSSPVKSKSPNELGIYDMSGNVWEWCQDRWKEDYYKESPSNNPSGPSSGSSRVLRGGSWYYFACFCRVSSRINSYPGNGIISYGMRLALPCSPFPS